MNTFKKITLALVLSFSLLPFAALADDPSDEDVDVAGQCSDVNLSQTQKDQLQAIRADTKAKLQTQRAQVKAAKEALSLAMADSSSTLALVIQKETALKSALGTMVDTLFRAANQVVFNVLSKDQRGPGLACYKKLKEELRKKILDKKCAARHVPGNEGLMDLIESDI